MININNRILLQIQFIAFIDFEIESDRLGLSGDLSYDDLTFSGHTIHANGELLVTLNGVNTEHLTAHDFELI